MTLAEHKYANKSRSELINEIVRLNNEVQTKNEEISLLKKKLALYRSLK